MGVGMEQAMTCFHHLFFSGFGPEMQRIDRPPYLLTSYLCQQEPARCNLRSLMASEEARPTAGDPHTAVPSPPLPFSLLPDVLHVAIASYVSFFDLAHLSAASNWFLHSRTYNARCLFLGKGREVGEDGVREFAAAAEAAPGADDAVDETDTPASEQEPSHAAMRRLLRRAHGVSRFVVVVRHHALSPLLSVLGEGLGRHLLALGLRPVRGETNAGEVEEEMLGTAMAAGVLPVLKSFFLGWSSSGGWEPVWRAMAAGACPHLEELVLTAPRGRVITAAAEALQEPPPAAVQEEGGGGGGANTTPPWEGIKELNIEAFSKEGAEAIGLLLRCWGLRGLRKLTVLNDRLGDKGIAAIGDALLETGAPSLKSLVVRTDFAFNGLPLARALAGGVAPELELLRLANMDWTRQAVQEVADEGLRRRGVWRHLRGMHLDKVLRDPGDLGVLLEAIGESHGCPDLHTIVIEHNRTRALPGPMTAFAKAFSARALPSLRGLGVHGASMSDFECLAAVLMQQGALALDRLMLFDCSDLDMKRLCSLASAIRGGCLPHLEMLTITVDSAVEKGVVALAEALPALPQLQILKLGMRVLGSTAMDALLQVLASGACPLMRIIDVSNTGWGPRVVDTCLNTAVALAQILGGLAPCSTSLEGLVLKDFPFHADDFMHLSRALDSTSRPARLRSLSLTSRGSSLEGVTALVASLGLDSGSRLAALALTVMDATYQEVEQVGTAVKGLFLKRRLMRNASVRTFNGVVVEVKREWQ